MNRTIFKRSIHLIIVLGIAILGAKGQVNITTWQGDLAHTGLNANETILTPVNVSASGSFGLLFTQPLDGQCYTQPLYLSGVKLPNGSVHNMVFVATEHDGVYAFDADSASGGNSAPLWYDSLLPAGTTTVPSGNANDGNLLPELGITATPVIDPTTQTLYTLSFVEVTSNSSYQQYLHALDLTTGAEKFGGPVLISTTFHGNGDSFDGVVNGSYAFNPLHYHERAALVLYNGIVYLTYASHSDDPPYHGVILGYNASTLQLVKQFNDTPNQPAAGIWQAGAGPAIDAAGNMYFGTGNGSFDQGSSSYTTDTDWGESFLKLPTSGTFDVTYSNPLNWFTPNIQVSLNNQDLDLGSGGLLLLPDQTGGTHVHLAVGGGKGGTLYVIDRDNMGGYNTTADNAVQEIAGSAELFVTPAYFNNSIYYAPLGGPLTQRTVGYNSANGTYISTTANTSTPTYSTRGTGVFISANGTSNGIVWAINPNDTLQAYNAANISGNPIYSFTTTVPGNSPIVCSPAKFTLPTIVNGKAYLTAFDSNNKGHLFVLGLLTLATTAPAAPSNLVATPSSSSEVTLTWTDNSNNESGFKVFRAAQAGGPFTQIGLTGANIATYSDSGLSPQTTYYYEVSATNNVGDSSLISGNATTFSPYAPTGLVAYWNFDEGSGLTANDITGNGHTGTLNGEVGWITGYVNTAINVHGTGNAISRITVPNTSTLQFAANQSFTLSAWVQPGALRNSDEAVIAKSRDQGNYYGLWINSSNQWVFRGPGGDVVGPTATVSTWTHVAGVQDGAAGTRTLYINGVAVGSGVAQAANGAGDFWIGQANGVTQPFPGTIDEVRLYNRALAPGEITSLLGPPVLQAVSRLTHGGAGTFNLLFPTNSAVPLEPRIGSPQGTYSLVLSFSAPVSGITASLGLQAGQTGPVVGAAGSASYDPSGKIVTVPLTGVGNAQCLNLHLTGIQPGNGTADIPLNVLWGKVNGTGAVNIGDALLIRSEAGQTLNGTTFLYDVNVDGQINIGDALLSRSLAGTVLP